MVQITQEKRGFTLIELLIVVAIILIIVAIAVPNLLKSRMAANEVSALGSIRAVSTAEITYFSGSGAQGYACDIASLGPGKDGAGLIDASLASGVKSGYVVTITCGEGAKPPFNNYFVEADPVTVGKSGTHSFCSDESGGIHESVPGVQCTMDSPVLQ